MRILDCQSNAISISSYICLSKIECVYRKCLPKDSSKFRLFVESLASDSSSKGFKEPGFANGKQVRTALESFHEIVRPKNLILELACFEKLVEADAEGQMIGHVDLCLSSDRRAVFGIAVRNGFRRNGIGTRLMNEFMISVKGLKKDQRTLAEKLNKIYGLVDKKNAGAIQLYRSLGFEFEVLNEETFEIHMPLM